ncbi:aspartic peptidase domain-containing protein [Cubamyces lactineus]|nr:aspartic peptidase domain-containing protein [Cubamyces lactineus]
MHLPPSAAPNARAWKGKQKETARDLHVRDEGTGGAAGIVIPIQLLQESDYQSVYVVPLAIGTTGNSFHLQVDTGSSDLWVASTSCSTSACNNVGGNKYNPSTASPTGQSATVDYAEGEVDGPIVWDSVTFGGYNIDNQALIAAANVNAEPLSSSFNGVLGLALPLNSQIYHQIPSSTSDVPDGAAFSSNLFGITPISTAPGARFFSIALERPGSDKVASTLGIGRHPSDLVPDPSKIQYSSIIQESIGPLFWQASVRAITVYANGQPKHVNLPLSSTGSNGQPSAILDTGVPLIIASQQITYGIYGALGYGPASDGNFYIPCNQPLNISITLDDRSEIPLHPLDMTYFPPSDPSGETCIGAIQTPDHIGFQLTQADMILGVPFLRNTYTVLAYDKPDADGTFPANAGSSRTDPRLGLLPLTDPATAAVEFHQVRVLKQPLGTSAGTAQGPTKKGLSVGIEVLIGLLGFFGLCFVLFGARMAYMKRKWHRTGRTAAAVDGSGGDSKEGSYVLNELGYHPAPRKSHSSEPSEDELRLKRFEEYKRRRELESSYTDDTALTRVESEHAKPDADEFGQLKVPRADDADPWEDTLVDSRPQSRPPPLALPSPPSPSLLADDMPTSRSARRSSYVTSPGMHQRTPSGGPSSATPLLAHGRTQSASNPRDSEDIAEFGMPWVPSGERDDEDRPVSMAGIGTSGRSRRLGSAGSGTMMLYPPSSSPLSPDDRRLSLSYPPGSYSPSHARSPSNAPLLPSSSSPLLSPAHIPSPPRGLEPVLGSASGSRNDSHVSVVGHEHA